MGQRQPTGPIPQMSEIEPGLFIGNLSSSYDPMMLERNNINAMVSLTNTPSSFWATKTRRYVPENRHKWVSCADSSTHDLLVQLEDICNFIEQMTLPTKLQPSSSAEGSAKAATKPSPGMVLVHCEQGLSRAPSVVIAYLMRKRGQKFNEVLDTVRARRKIEPSPTFTRQLKIWEQVEYDIWQNTEEKIPKAPYQAFLEERAVVLKAKGLAGNDPVTLVFS